MPIRKELKGSTAIDRRAALPFYFCICGNPPARQPVSPNLTGSLQTVSSSVKRRSATVPE